MQIFDQATNPKRRSMLSSIGLRIERLLYLVFFLLLMCALQVYLTAAAVHFNATDTRILDSFIQAIEEKQSELSLLYNEGQRIRRPTTDRDKRVATMRESLGLPASQLQETLDGQKYKARLREILLSTPQWYTLNENTINAEKPIEQILLDLRQLRQSKIQDRGTVLGIEIPRLYTLQYGSAAFRLSAQPLAFALLIALYPLTFVWLGSFYITRQRELLALRALKDYKQAFPHILNFVAVDFSSLQQRMGILVKRKDARINLLASKIATTTLRGVFLTITVTPLVAGLGYSTIQLHDLLELPIPATAVATVAYIVMMALTFGLIIQEITALRGKIFYE
ncbi:hypothetical protein GT347_25055 [Xylophilus rhododendri]|uniref:Uncharacterized protein n=1 Tax=Xylophilus rhododendri TaxID=2697032 RepID=A0A857JBA8_9BURK|nr:hypothetical protein [Xylophilus rhododendri]QHJ00968.1 hypothetical protein GT347_25055 [Xylophilus rhododendri]